MKSCDAKGLAPLGNILKCKFAFVRKKLSKDFDFVSISKLGFFQVFLFVPL